MTLRYHPWLLVILLGILACSERTETSSVNQPDYISFHWPSEQPQANVRTCVLLSTGEEIALEPQKVIGTEHFTRAYVSGADDFVTVRLTDAGRSILAEATERRVGDRLAIVVNDTIVAMPTITRTLDVAEIPLMPQPSTAAAETFAQNLNHAIAARQSSGN